MPDEIEIIIAELTYWLDRWETGCRWFAADPARANNEAAYRRLCEVAEGWGLAMEALSVLAPEHPALVVAQARLDAVSDMEHPEQSAA